ncbi:MAG TPA: AAA family ATPase [Gemmatimonadaceae bacterium]|nr:AAA family ATPase [Gemmatimonadaceae bacterium]
MNADTGSLSSFVPARLAALLDVAPDQPMHRAVAGAVLYADIAGSCELADRLVARHGADGMDELSGLLNATFEPLIDAVMQSGGEIVQFAGDALLAVWLAPQGALGDAARAATDTALQFGPLLAGRPVLAAQGITVRAGVGAGAFGAARVGGAAAGGRWEIVVSGAAVEDAFRAAAAAPAGSALAARSVIENADGLVTGTGANGFFGALQAGRSPRDAAAAPAPMVADPARFVPEVVRARVSGGFASWVAELRHVSVMFVNVHGADFAGDAHVRQLDAATCAIKNTLHEHNGYFRQLSVDDKGVVVVAAFGVPPVRRERQPGDAIHAANRISQALEALGMRASIGIASGRVFCGVIGSALRREYTLIGNVVNRAARLMMVERGTVVCDDVTATDAHLTAEFEAMPSMSLKGIAEPVTPARVRAVRDIRPSGAYANAALSGPDLEISICLDLAASAAAADARTVVIEGAAGQGKSTLLSAMAAEARRAGFAVVTGIARWNGQSSPYHAWIPIIETVLGIDAITDETARRERARAFLFADPALARVAALLNDVVSLGLDETPYTAGLDGLHRAEGTRALIARLLTAYRGMRPLLILIDDAQWCDPASWSLVVKAPGLIGRVVTVLTARPLDTVPDEARPILDQPETLRRRLGPLGASAIANAGAVAAGVRALDPVIVAWLDQRSGGNPFFARQLMFALIDRGVLRVANGEIARSPSPGELAAISVPASVESLVLSRFDALDPSHQILLKAGSVIGARFSVRELAAVHPQPERVGRLREDLDALVRTQFLTVTGDECAFTHQIVRDVAYGTMVGAQRKAMHERFATFLEGAHDASHTGEYSRLALHWEAAGADAQTFRYLELSGAEAARIGAFREAIAAFTKLLARDANRGRPATMIQRARWHRQLGDAYEGVGEMSDAERNMRDALVELGRAVPSSETGWTAVLLRAAFQQLAHLVIKPRAYPAGSPQRAVESEVARATITIAEVRLQENSAAGVAGAVFVSANACDRLGPTTGVARPYSMVGSMFAMLHGNALAQRYWSRARAIAREAGDVSGEVRTDMGEAYAAFYNGHFAHAGTLLARNTELAGAHGLGRELEMNEATYAGLFLIQGRYKEHRDRGQRLLETTRARSSPLGEIWALIMLMGNAVHTGDFEAAEQHIASVRRHRNLLNQEAVVCDGWDLALQIRREDWWTARSLADKVATGLGIPRQGTTRGRPIVVVAHWQAMACYGEATLAFLERASPSEREAVLRNARYASRAMRGFAKRFAIAMPFALAHEGRLACLSGKPEKGFRTLDRAAALAQRMGMPFAYAHALRYRGLLEEARAEFTKLGCIWEARRTAELMRASASNPGE